MCPTEYLLLYYHDLHGPSWPTSRPLRPWSPSCTEWGRKAIQGRIQGWDGETVIQLLARFMAHLSRPRELSSISPVAAVISLSVIPQRSRLALDVKRYSQHLIAISIRLSHPDEHIQSFAHVKVIVDSSDRI